MSLLYSRGLRVDGGLLYFFCFSFGMSAVYASRWVEGCMRNELDGILWRMQYCAVITLPRLSSLSV